MGWTLMDRPWTVEGSAAKPAGVGTSSPLVAARLCVPSNTISAAVQGRGFAFGAEAPKIPLMPLLL